MFTAAAAAASADVRAKRNRFASHRSFSASELNGIKRRQAKAQTANALDILSTYLTVAEDGPGGGSHNHHKFRSGGQSSARTSIASSRESSRACSPVVEEYQQQQQGLLLPRSNTTSSGSNHRSSAANTFFTNFFSSLPSEHHPHHKTSLSLPSSNGPLHTSHSHSTSSIVEHCSGVASSTAATAAAPPAVEVVAMLRDPAWSEIARLSHSDDMDDVDGHGHRCGHRRRFDRQNKNPFDAYTARKRFISAINRIRMESMVCSALNPNGSPTFNATTKSGHKVSTLTEYPEPHSAATTSRKGSSPLPPQVLINDDERAKGDDDDDFGNGDGDDHHSSTATISMAELGHELDHTMASPAATAAGNCSPSSSSQSSSSKLWHRTSTPARASSSPQIAHQEHSNEQQLLDDDDDGLNWAPLMQGRAIERSTSSATRRPPANFTCLERDTIGGEGALHMLQKDSTTSSRQRSSSATSMTMFLEQEAAAAATTTSSHRSKSPSNLSPEKKKQHSKHSFMALIRIKMFSVKRQRKPLKVKEEEEKKEGKVRSEKHRS